MPERSMQGAEAGDERGKVDRPGKGVKGGGKDRVGKGIKQDVNKSQQIKPTILPTNPTPSSRASGCRGQGGRAF